MNAPLFLGWTLDIARDQSPTADRLIELARRSSDAGYAALGLYLEHRFAYPSAPWAAAEGCATPRDIRCLRQAVGAGGVRVIPFLNTLGHMEGFVRAEGGHHLAEGEERFSAQICPSRPECRAFATQLVQDAVDAFDDEWIHLGGDETKQLGQCPLCRERLAAVGPAGLYADYFEPLCRRVLALGRRPCLWADMLLQHPEALPRIPRETVLFDWQYFGRPGDTSARLRKAGFDVVCCPSVQSYNSAWCFLDHTQQRIDEHVEDARRLGALGVLLTTWEFTYFSSFESVEPIVFAAGLHVARGMPWDRALLESGGERFAVVARLLGRELPATSAFLAPGTWRLLRDHLVMRQNPFSLWRAWREDAVGPTGDAILNLCDRAQRAADGEPRLRLPIDLHRAAVEWVRHVESSRAAYAADKAADCVARLDEGADALDRLRPALTAVAERGGSRVDLARLDRLLDQVRTVQARVRALARTCAWRPAFEEVIRDGYLPGDQAAWRTRAVE